MGLDIHKTAVQIESMTSFLEGVKTDLRNRRLAAAALLASPLERDGQAPLDLETLRLRLDAGSRRLITWLVAGHPLPGLKPSLSVSIPSPKPPVDYSVLAMDGSQIDIDRHGPAHLFLINIGGAEIRYGSCPSARLVSEPTLFSRPEQLVISDPSGGMREQGIDGPILGIKRMVMECDMLEQKLRQLPTDLPTLGLLDGSLVVWELSGDRYPDFVKDYLLKNGFLATLDRLKTQRTNRLLALGSYISHPRSTEVVNILRVAQCPWDSLEKNGCDHFCGRNGPGQRECDQIALGLMDRDLFEMVLAPGERSEIFSSQSLVVTRDYGPHQIHFFYINVGNEIARVEMPQWVADDPLAVDLLHSGVLDQCRKGNGYPVALQEAHEQAVVTMADRRYFWSRVQQSLDGHRIPARGTLKARSKRIRAV